MAALPEVFERMMRDLAHARARVSDALVNLAARGQKLDALTQTAHQLDEDSIYFQRRAIGVVDQRWPARFCRLCWFDVEFRHFVCASVLGTLLFVGLVLTHWWLTAVD